MSNKKRHMSLVKGFTIGYTSKNEVSYSIAQNLTVNEVLELSLVMVREVIKAYVAQKEKEKYPDMRTLRVHLHDTTTIMFNRMMDEVFRDVLYEDKQIEAEVSEMPVEDGSSPEHNADGEHVLDEVLPPKL